MLLGSTLLFATPQAGVAREDLADEGGWFTLEGATGEWGGWRQRLNALGVAPALNYTADLLVNPLGGERQDAAYAAQFYGSVTLDLETIAGLPGLSFYAAAAWDQGRDLSDEAIGNIFDVAEVESGLGFGLAEVYLQQTLWDDRLSLAAGRLASGDDFATVESFGYYVNAAINSNPLTLEVNAPAFTAQPYTQWGVRTALQLGQQVTLKAGAYNSDLSSELKERHGTSYAFDLDQGVLAIAEIDYASGTTLPGHYLFGGYYDSSVFTVLADPGESERGSYGFYAIAEQQVYREPIGREGQGLTAWAALTLSPESRVNTLPVGAFAGLLYRGLLPGHARDTTGLAAYYGRFSDDLPDQSYELVLEANHRFQFAPWFYLAPVAQYVVNPNGQGIPNAAVFGMEVGIDF